MIEQAGRRRPTLPRPLRLLILGGTTEASLLAHRLAGSAAVEATLSLAGRTQSPLLPPIPHRIGGFGGLDGLTRFLADTGTDAVIDATHPFAARISAHAVAACGRLALPRAVFTRPPWTADAADRWTGVADIAAAAQAIGPAPQRVLLTSGRLGLAAFKAAPQHAYVGRTIDPPDPADLPPDYTPILGRGPFSTADEIALLRDRCIDVVVSKNSGGAAGLDKLVAARTLGRRVILVEPPAPPPGLVLTDLSALEHWIASHLPAP